MLVFLYCFISFVTNLKAMEKFFYTARDGIQRSSRKWEQETGAKIYY